MRAGRPGGLGRRKRLRPSRKLRRLRLWRLALQAQSGCGGRRYNLRRPNEATSSSPFQYYLAGTPSADLRRRKGEAEGGRRLETGRSSGLGPSQLSVAAPGSLPFSRTAGCAESRTRGVGPLWCPLEPPEDFPLWFSLVHPLSPPASLLPGGCGQVSTVAGPATRDRVVRALRSPPATQMRSLNPSAGENRMLGN